MRLGASRVESVPAGAVLLAGSGGFCPDEMDVCGGRALSSGWRPCPSAIARSAHSPSAIHIAINNVMHYLCIHSCWCW